MSDDDAPPPPAARPRRPLGRRLALLLGVLAAAAAVAEWLMPSPLDPWIPPLLQAERGGRVTLRAGDDASRWPTIARQPQRPRVLWLGASTVAGVPFDPWSSPPRWLELLLGAQGADVEVVGVAAPGKRARDLVAWLPEVLSLHPVAIVLTTGHNEYLDAHRLLTDSWIERSALLHPLLRGLGVEFGARDDGPSPTRRFDPARVAGAVRDELARARRLCEEAGVPLLLTLPVSNLADCPPVLGRAAQDAFAQARARLEARDPAGALPLLLRARDEDEWPARADTRILDAVRVQGEPLVDVPARFDEAARGRPPGFNLFMDHCHPTLAGQRLLALAVADALSRQGVVPPPPPGTQPPGLDEGLAALGAPRALEQTGRVRSLRALLHLAFLGEPGNPMTGTARTLARTTWVSIDDPVSAVLLAVLEGDGDAALAALGRASTSDRRELARLARTWGRVAAAFARAGIDPAALEEPPP